MLLLTDNGRLINLAHAVSIQVVTYQRDNERDTFSRVEAIMLLPTGTVPLTGEVGKAFAEFLVKDMAVEWANGTRLYDVKASREKLREGAYFSEDPLTVNATV